MLLADASLEAVAMVDPANERDESVVPGVEKTIESADLFDGEKQVAIRHGDEVYRLIITRNNKLILHK